MAYSIQTDVASEFKKITFAAGQPITDTEVTEFIVQADALIDGYIASRYIVPVTAGAGALSVLKQISIDIVAYRVTKILNIKKAIPTPDKDLAQEIMEGTAYRHAMKRLKDISKGLLILDGADDVSSSGGFKSYNVANSVEPVIKKYERQW